MSIKKNNCIFVLKKLSNLLERKEDCKDNGCKITNLKNVVIFKTEESDKAKNLLKRYGYEKSPKYCDCIIFKGRGKRCLIIIIEILCGTLTAKELRDKENQVITWKDILEKIFKKTQNILGFICYQKVNYKTFGDNKTIFKWKKTNLMNKNIRLTVFKETRGRSYHIRLKTLLTST